MTLDDALTLSKPLRELYESDPTGTQAHRHRQRPGGHAPPRLHPRRRGGHHPAARCTTYVPLAKNDEAVVTQYTMTTLEELGLLKMDFLGLRNLTVLDDAVQMVRRRIPDFDLHAIPDDDPETFQMLSDGQTSGVFQMESAGMTGVCVGLKPQNIEDITAIIALYRPGPMESIPRFIACKHNPDSVTLQAPHAWSPSSPVTYGCIVYQEQVIRNLPASWRGYSLGQADMVRRAMSKKKMPRHPAGAGGLPPRRPGPGTSPAASANGIPERRGGEHLRRDHRFRQLRLQQGPRGLLRHCGLPDRLV